MSTVDAWCTSALDSLRRQQLTRELEPIEKAEGTLVTIAGTQLISFSSNDYLGLAQDRAVREAAAAAALQHGVGATASRLVVGDSLEHQALEAELAAFEGTEAALLFGSGYAANTGVLPALVGPGDVVFSDALNHASLIDGCRLSRAQVVVYPHADVDALQQLLETHRGRRRLVVTDTVFSMDGDRAPLGAISRLCRAHDVGLYVDEAHATGVLGAHGVGLCELEDVRPDVRMGTLSKAIGASGAYVATSKVTREFLLSSARSLIFSTALPFPVVAAARAGLRRLRDPGLRSVLWRHIERVAAALQVPAHSAVFSIVLGSPTAALEASATLRARGLLVKAIRPPTVPEGTSRLRISLSALHTEAQVDALLEALPKASTARPVQAPTRTQALLADDAAHVWHPFTQMQQWPDDRPLVIERAQGNWLIDTEGNRYLDGCSSLWVTVHGHRRAELDAAVTAQLNKVAHSTLLGLASVPSIELAKKLCQVAPKGLERVFYSDSGSTAVEVGVKLAYQYWQLVGRPEKRRFVALDEAYHGDTLGSVSVGGMALFHERFRHLLFEVDRIPTPHAYRWQGDDVLEESLAAAERLLAERHEQLAGLVIEPLVQGAAGMLMQPVGYLRRLAALCRKYEVLLICDEVATGFGRTGTLFAVEQEGVTPDILCLAKGLTGGYLPLAATLTTNRVYEAFLGSFAEAKTFFHGHTYTGNPLACAAALASLELFETDQTLARLPPVMTVLQQGLERLAQHPQVGDVRRRGMMIGVELVKDRATKAPFEFEARLGFRVCAAARQYGVWLRPLGNVIVLMPPLSLTVAEAGRLITAVERALDDTFRVR